eukprot:14115660-Ditylum_brightwellii.AAC.1
MCGDETSLATIEYEEPGPGVKDRVEYKPGVNKGGHMAPLKLALKTVWVYQDGKNIEVWRLMEDLKPVVEEEGGNANKILIDHPHSAWDDHISDDIIMD